MNTKFFFTTLFLAAWHALAAQCNPGEIKVTIEIDPDEAYQSVGVGVALPDFSGVFAFEFLSSDGYAKYEFCVPEYQRCSNIFIYDSQGDGMGDQGAGDHGWFKMYVNDELVLDNPTGEFEEFVSYQFNCPEGATCHAPFTAELGADTIPDGYESWYAFTPQETGTYLFDACQSENTCRVKFWLYGFCENLVLTDNQAGALFYSDGNCPLGTKATMYLEGGKTYYLRIKYRYPSCIGHPLVFNLSYQGPVKGCTDPAACNYQPLATVSDTCIYEGIACEKLPDLETDEGLLRSSMEFEIYFNGNECTIDEGCLRGFGKRSILRFSTRVSNVGEEDYYIGETPADPDTPSDQFIYDPCHQHWHYRGYAEYLLYKADGTRVPVGSKNGFCVLDLECSDGGFGKYTCENMGITAGCGDVYDSSLDCQWIDITDLPAGAYTFVMRVNWDKSPDKNGRLEKGYDNNWAQACFVLSYDDDNEPVVEMIDECPSFVDCQGEIFGNSQPDCEGICSGTAKQGDFTKNLTRDSEDVNAYLNAALNGGANATPCLDLNDDGRIHLYDAALLQECVLHENDPQYWGSRIPCNFPGGLKNPNDHMTLSLGTLNKSNKTLDIRIFNPSYTLYGLQFTISGLLIESIESLDAFFNPEIRFNAAGEIVLLALNEVELKKHGSNSAFLRIHYSELTAAQVCLSALTVAVNSKYQASNAVIGSPSCLNTGLTSIVEAEEQAYVLTAVPNPFSASTDVYFDNPDQNAVNVTLRDLSGKVVRRFDEVKTEQISIERQGLPGGVYIFSVQGPKGISYLKLVID